MPLCLLSLFSCVQLFSTLQTVAGQSPLSMGFSRKEYCSGLTFPSPGDLPDPGTKPQSPALVGRFFTTEPPGKSLVLGVIVGIQTTPAGPVQPVCVEIAVQNLNRILPKPEAPFLIKKLTAFRDEISAFVKVCQS